jgi:GNAT superfamily N-acetyltransferase
MMGGERIYPDERADAFPRPPERFVDAEGREVEVRRYEDDDRDALVEMYLAFDPADRAQGIPPGSRGRIEAWLDDVLAGDCLNLLAVHDGDPVAHATLVPADDDSYELAIFVLQPHQGAGVGGRLLRTLLGHAREAGVERVWLTVERWNRAAVGLYESVGFETSDAESFELEMAIRL